MRHVTSVSKTDVTPAIFSRDFLARLSREKIAARDCAVACCDSVAAIQVVQVVLCTRAHDPWGPTSEDQIAIFLKN